MILFIILLLWLCLSVFDVLQIRKLKAENERLKDILWNEPRNYEKEDEQLRAEYKRVCSNGRT